MRVCTRCNTQMIENYDLNVEGKLYGVELSNKERDESLKKRNDIKVAICPRCGELSLFTNLNTDIL